MTDWQDLPDNILTVLFKYYFYLVQILAVLAYKKNQQEDKYGCSLKILHKIHGLSG